MRTAALHDPQTMCMSSLLSILPDSWIYSGLCVTQYMRNCDLDGYTGGAGAERKNWKDRSSFSYNICAWLRLTMSDRFILSIMRNISVAQ